MSEPAAWKTTPMRDLTASQRKLRDDLLDEPLARYSDLELIDRFVEMAEKVYGEEIDKILLGQQEQEAMSGFDEWGRALPERPGGLGG